MNKAVTRFPMAAISAAEVTIPQVDSLLGGAWTIMCHENKDQITINVNEWRDQSVACPFMSWHAAAMYCHRLSEAEGLSVEEWCYARVKDDELNDDLKVDLVNVRMYAVPNYLSRTGFRVPTEAEWEYACRAGSATARFFGNSDQFLSEYRWWLMNSEMRAHPTCLLKPNDNGLFDMIGNVAEWCHALESSSPSQDAEVETQEYKDDEEAFSISMNTIVGKNIDRVLRDEAYLNGPWVQTSFGRQSRPDISVKSHFGFRVARTISEP